MTTFARMRIAVCPASHKVLPAPSCFTRMTLTPINKLPKNCVQIPLSFARLPGRMKMWRLAADNPGVLPRCLKETFDD